MQAYSAWLNGHTPLIITKEMAVREIEKRMEEVAAGTLEKEDLVKQSREILSEIVDVLEKNKEAVSAEIRLALREDKFFGPCPACAKPLMQRKGYSGKRFVGCTGYPDCHTTFPLPQLGVIQPGEKPCPTCAKPTIFVQAKRYRYTMCLDPQCLSKKDWKKKTETAPAAAAPTPAESVSQKPLVEKKERKKPAIKIAPKKKPAPKPQLVRPKGIQLKR